MDHIVSELILYGDMPQDAVLMQLSDICRHLREHTCI